MCCEPRAGLLSVKCITHALRRLRALFDIGVRPPSRCAMFLRCMQPCQCGHGKEGRAGVATIVVVVCRSSAYPVRSAMPMSERPSFPLTSISNDETLLDS